MRRRDFITLLGSTAATPLVAHAQQPAMPVIGYLSALSKATVLEQTAKFIRGLHEMGFVDGENVVIEYRWADGQYVEAGGLMSYGPNFPDLYRRAADFVDKILRGAKPADMPVDPVGGGLVASY